MEYGRRYDYFIETDLESTLAGTLQWNTLGGGKRVSASGSLRRNSYPQRQDSSTSWCGTKNVTRWEEVASYSCTYGKFDVVPTPIRTSMARSGTFQPSFILCYTVDRPNTPPKGGFFHRPSPPPFRVCSFIIHC